jgi:hypothetical protein
LLSWFAEANSKHRIIRSVVNPNASIFPDLERAIRAGKALRSSALDDRADQSALTGAGARERTGPLSSRAPQAAAGRAALNRGTALSPAP